MLIVGKLLIIALLLLTVMIESYKIGRAPMGIYGSMHNNDMKSYEILSRVNSLDDLKSLDEGCLPLLCNELRRYMKDVLFKVGGHYSSSLGVVELTVMLHRIFNSPNDRIIWDIGHQAYIHKILTGRRDLLNTIRQKDGISGYCRRYESIHDQFGAGHSSTSIGGLQGLYEADLLLNNNIGRNYICIIGDGGMTAGLAYESLNYSCCINSPLIIIYNDNEQSSLPTGLPSVSGTNPIVSFLMNDENIYKFKNPNIIGPINGHDLNELNEVLLRVKAIQDDIIINKNKNIGPIIIHLKTVKGKDCNLSLNSLDRLHSIYNKSNKLTYTDIFANTLINMAKYDNKIVAITAAMPGGTGVGKFGKVYPNRTFDVGIAEQHAVTFSAGLALGGIKPYCCIYSTFLQRSYDQVIHDVSLQNAPVKFIIDRAGYVGTDGSSHHGLYDLSYLRPIPNFIIMAPSNELELQLMIKFSNKINHTPCAIRFPKSNILGYKKLIDIYHNNTYHPLAVPPEVQSNSLRLADSSSNYLSLKSIATPGDRGDVNPEEQDMSTRKKEDIQLGRTGILPGGTGNINPEEQTSNVVNGPQVEPAADLREAEGQLNRRADGRTTSGGEWKDMTSTGKEDEDIFHSSCSTSSHNVSLYPPIGGTILVDNENINDIMIYNDDGLLLDNKFDNEFINNLMLEIESFKGRIIRYGDGKAAILTLGTILYDMLTAIESNHLNCTLVDIRFLKPLDEKLVNYIAHNHKIIITAEDGLTGGLGSAILEYISDNNINTHVRTIRYPSRIVHHASQSEQKELVEYDVEGLSRRIKCILDEIIV